MKDERGFQTFCEICSYCFTSGIVWMIPQDLSMSCTWVFAHVFRNVCVCVFCSLSSMCGFFFEAFSQSSFHTVLTNIYKMFSCCCRFVHITLVVLVFFDKCRKNWFKLEDLLYDQREAPYPGTPSDAVSPTLGYLSRLAFRGYAVFQFIWCCEISLMQILAQCFVKKKRKKKKGASERAAAVLIIFK